MKDYLAVKGTTGAWITSREQAKKAILSGFEIYEDDQLVASSLDDIDKLDLEPWGVKNG